MAGLKIRFVDRIDRLPAAKWDSCAGDDNPFLRHAFLDALEQSGSIGGSQGWMPQHLALEDEFGQLVAAAPLYVKSHSQGEYVFDHGWAEAWARAGGRYYPKLQVAVPFTPVPGRRLLVRDAEGSGRLRAVLAKALMDAAERSNFSSVHVTFAGRDDIEALREAGFMIRTSLQYHWRNDGYETFADFLAALSARKRKAIRKERQAVASAGLKIRALNGKEITSDCWDAFFSFYLDTGGRKWGRPYLTREFFARIGESMAEDILLVLADRDGRTIAGALNFIGKDALFGRHWGCIEDHRFLHFELCYYQAIEYAIGHRLSRVEAGAQGEHKIQRGYLPTETPSAHWIVHPGFRAAVDDFLDRETRAIGREMSALKALSPYRETVD